MRRLTQAKAPVVILGLLAIALPASGQMQMPVPPVPGPYSLMPAPLGPTPQAPQPTVDSPLSSPNMPGAAPQLPYWMQAPAEANRSPDQGGAQVHPSPPSGNSAAVANQTGFAGAVGAAIQGYGQAMAPGYFPSYQQLPWQRPLAAPQNSPSQGMGGTVPQGANAGPALTYGSQGYAPQGYGPQPGWGPAPGWGQPQAGWGAPGWTTPQTGAFGQ